MSFIFVFWQEQFSSNQQRMSSLSRVQGYIHVEFDIWLDLSSTWIIWTHKRGMIEDSTRWNLYHQLLGDVDAYIMGGRVKPRQEVWWWWYPFPCPCMSLCMGSPGIGGGWYKWQWGDVDIMAGRNFGDGDTQAHGRLAVRRWGRGRVGPSPMGPAGLLWVLCSS